MMRLSGSDLHVTTNSPPQVRVHGHLQPLDMPPLTPADTKQLAYSVMTDAQKHRFEEEFEIDFSFGLKGLARFRANVFIQRGAVAAVFRVIPFEIKSFQQLNLPPIVGQVVRETARPHPGDRAHGLGQNHHPGGDDRQDQQRTPRPHHHHRGPDRVRASAQELPGEPARSAPGHQGLSSTPCAPRCAKTRTWC